MCLNSGKQTLEFLLSMPPATKPHAVERLVLCSFEGILKEYVGFGGVSFYLARCPMVCQDVALFLL